MKTFQIIAIEDGFDFRDGSRSMSAVVALGRDVVKIPIEQSAAEVLVALRAAAKAALKPAAVVVPGAAPAPAEALDDDDEAPIKLGVHDDDEEEL